MANISWSLLRMLIWDAVEGLTQSGQRSALALLGIVIGAAAVLILFAVGDMSERETLRQYEEMGVNSFELTTQGGIEKNDGGRGSFAGLSLSFNLASLEALPLQVTSVEMIAPLETGRVKAGFDSRSDDVALAASIPQLQKIAGLRLRQGRFISDIDGETMVAVVGSGAADDLAISSSGPETSKTIRVGRYLFTVVGTLAPLVRNSYSPVDFNEAIIIPLSDAKRVLGSAPLNSALGQMRRGSDAAATSAEIKSVLAKDDPRLGVQVQSARELIAALHAQHAVQTRILASLGGISLLVGGIGVMNVMLMSLMERRREIGLRAAVGASPRAIQLTFLAEAAMLSTVGGVAGCMAGLIVAWFVALRSGWEFHVPIEAPLLSAGSALAMGVLFGTYPAIKASGLDPIAALRGD